MCVSASVLNIALDRAAKRFWIKGGRPTHAVVHPSVFPKAHCFFLATGDIRILHDERCEPDRVHVGDANIISQLDFVFSNKEQAL